MNGGNKVTRLRVEKSLWEKNKEESSERAIDKELDEGIVKLSCLLGKNSKGGGKEKMKLREMKEPELVIHPKRVRPKTETRWSKRMRFQSVRESSCQSVRDNKDAVDGQFESCFHSVLHVQSTGEVV